MTHYAYIGTSYESGWMLPDPSKRWPRLHADAAGAEELNYAVPGAGYLNPGAGGASTFQQQAQKLIDSCKAPDRIIIAGGINDAQYPGSTPDLVAAALTKLLATLAEAFPDTPVTVLPPMWSHTTPLPELLAITAGLRKVRPDLAAGGAWIRYNRPDLGYYDGHPTEAGHQLIAAWVQGLEREGIGETFARFHRGGTGDSAFVGNGVNIAEGVIYGAKPGQWELTGTAAMYGNAAGFLYVAGNGARHAARCDLTGTPAPYGLNRTHQHSGGDLLVQVGYSTAAGTANVISNDSTDITARWVSN